MFKIKKKEDIKVVRKVVEVYGSKNVERDKGRLIDIIC